MACSGGYQPAREYSIRTRLDSVVTVATSERSAPAALLLEGDGGRQPLNHVHVRDTRLVDQPARVRRHGLQVASLRLREQRAEREGRLPRAGHPREHHDGVPGQVQGDVPEVVLARAAHHHAVLPGCGAVLFSSHLVHATRGFRQAERACPSVVSGMGDNQPYSVLNTVDIPAGAA